VTAPLQAPGPNAPDYWPDRPLEAIYGYNALPAGPATCWLVYGLPPEPWPNIDRTSVHGSYGPDWTTYIFSNTALAVRYALEAAANPTAFETGVIAWETPLIPGKVEYVLQLKPLPPEVPMSTTSCWRATVHANTAQGEEAANVFHFSDLGVPYTPDIPGALLVGAAVRDAWHAFMFSAAAFESDVSMKGAFPPSLSFNEVRVARITVTSPAPLTGVGGKPHPVNYDVATQFVPFAPPIVGASQTTLPYEVACVLSHTTGQRGKSHRGRTYLGPLGGGLMSGNTGLFGVAGVTTIAASFWTNFVQTLKTGTAGKQLQLCVLSTKLATTFPVTGVRVGVVPDSQRRRRKKLLENYVLAGGTL
jgi:hypothetical protein